MKEDFDLIVSDVNKDYDKNKDCNIKNKKTIKNLFSLIL